MKQSGKVRTKGTIKLLNSFVESLKIRKEELEDRIKSIELEIEEYQKELDE
tara:strand:+ start:68874 stop:69026 length:153 start_codon:yes stop_codon:yes gene_type:complete